MIAETESAIVLLAAHQDRDAAAVAACLPTERILWIDSERLHRREALTWSVDTSGTALFDCGDKVVRSSEIGSVFHRPDVRIGPGERIAPYLLLPSLDLDDDYHEFARREAEAFVLGSLLGPAVRWVNDPGAGAAAELKLRQLATAARLGLDVPATLVTDDSDRLTAFWQEQGGRVVTKAVDSASAWAISETLVTRAVSAGDLELLAAAPPCVTLFQELVPAAFDLRVTLVGQETFVCVIDSQQGESPLDWRLDQSVPMRQGLLPEPTVAALQELRIALGLEYGAADLRMTPDGTPVFLEINPRGGFAFVEERTGMPIAKSVAQLLTSSRG